VGVLYGSERDSLHVELHKGLESEARAIEESAGASGRRAMRLNAKAAGRGAEGIELQIAQMHELISAGVDLLLVQPANSAALVKPLRRANAEGIPVITFDGQIAEGEVAAHVGADNERGGRLCGEFVAARFPDDSTIRLVLVEDPYVSGPVERINGLLAGLDGSGQPYTVAAGYGASDRLGGQRAATAMLRDFPDTGSVDVVFAAGPRVASGIAQLLLEAGRLEITVAAVDGDPELTEHVRAGRLTVIDCVQPGRKIGSAAARAAWALLHGEPVAPITRLPVFPLTLETADHFDTWTGDLSAELDLPWAGRESSSGDAAEEAAPATSDTSAAGATG